MTTSNTPGLSPNESAGLKAIQDFLASLGGVDLPDGVKEFFNDSMENIAALVRDRAPDDPSVIAPPPTAPDFLRVAVDQRHLLKDRTPKWRRVAGSIPATHKKHQLLAHHTGNGRAGGFGTRKDTVKAYASLWDDGMVDTTTGVFTREHMRSWHPRVSALGSTDLALAVKDWLTRASWTRLMALAARYRGFPNASGNRGEPYHAISAANSALYLNLPFDIWSYHGDDANRHSVGWAWDGDSRYEPIARDSILTRDLIFDGQAIIDLARQEGHDIDEITCHCVYSNKPNDPGADFILHVLVPLAELTGCQIRWDYADKGGHSLASVLKRHGRVRP